VRAVRIVAAVLGGLILVSVGGFFAFFPRIAGWGVQRYAIPKVERKLGRDVSVRKVRVGYGTVTLEGVTVRGSNDPELRSLATVDKVTTSFPFWKALRGDVQLGEVKIEKPRIALVRTADGKDNWSDVLERLRKKDPDAEEGAGKRPLFTGVTVVGASLDLDDAASGVRFSAREIGAGMTPGGPVWARLQQISVETVFGPRAAANAIQIEGDLSDLQGTAKVVVEGGSAALWPRMSLTGIHGSIEPAGSSRATIHFEGGYGGVDEKLWEADGWFDPRSRDAELSLKADKFTLDRLAPILAGTPVQTPERASVETHLDLRLREGETLQFRGDLKVAGLTLFDPWLAEKAIKDLAFTGDLSGRFERGGRMLEIEKANLSFRGVTASLEGYAALKGGHEQSGELRSESRMGVHFTLPKVTCQQALQAFPPELVPRLQGFKLKGDFGADVHFDVDWANLDALVLDGSVGIYNCKFKEAPKEVEAKLQHTFEHVVELEEDKWISFDVGPTNPNYVPLYDVSPYVVRSFLTTEDGGFYKHHGFIVREFRSALIKNLKEGYFKYGASSITMQFVKNVFLYREKTVARKLQELFLTHYVESTIDKDRILEIYVNVIEFGPGIYGIGPAARHYFAKHPRDLNPVEAAFFSSILPSPKKRHLQYCDGELNRWGDAKVHRILKVMRERDRLTDEEYQLAMKTPLIFDRTDAPNPAECKKVTKRYIKNARPTLPQRATN
jgi:hypothetical protein